MCAVTICQKDAMLSGIGKVSRADCVANSDSKVTVMIIWLDGIKLVHDVV